MATTKQDDQRISPRGLLLTALGLVVVVVVAGVAWLYMVFTRPPQMGIDEQAFGAVDALFTAVTSHNEKLVNDCEQRLHKLTDQGKLPRDAADYLDEVMKMCHAGHWDPAAKRLYGFMRAQRRDDDGTSGTRKTRKTANVGQSPTNDRRSWPRAFLNSVLVGESALDAMT
jgi:hypothetical protein